MSYEIKIHKTLKKDIKIKDETFTFVVKYTNDIHGLYTVTVEDKKRGKRYHEKTDSVEKVPELLLAVKNMIEVSMQVIDKNIERLEGYVDEF